MSTAGAYFATLERLLNRPALYLGFGIAFFALAASALLGAEPTFSQRTIGIAIIDGQDPSLRNVVYVACVLGSVCLFAALFLRARVSSSLSEITTQRGAPGTVAVSALLGNAVLYWQLQSPVLLLTLYAIVFLIALGVAAWALERRGFTQSFLWILAALVYQGMLTASAVIETHLAFGPTYFLAFVLCLFNLVLLSLPLAATGKAVLSENGIAYWLLPAMYLPLSIILANELHYTLGLRSDYQGTALPLWLGLVCIVLVTLVIRLVRYPTTLAASGSTASASQVETLLLTRYLPLVLVSTVAFTEYASTINFFRTRDFFHGGEAIVPVQQMLQFGSVPYIDFYPPHGFFDILPQLFYQMINPGQYIESVLWGQGYGLGWLPRSLSILAMYWLLRHFVGYTGAFLILFLLPTYHVVHPYYVVLILPLLFLPLTHTSIIRWALFWLSLLLVFLWRIDFGITVTAATAFLLLCHFWQARCTRSLRHCWIGAALVGATSLLAFLLLATLRDKPALEVAASIAQYILIQTPLSAMANIVHQVDFAAILQYAILPLVGAVIAAYFLALALQRKPLTQPLVIVGFLSVVSLVIAARSLNRHSLYEGVFNPYFFTLLAALLPLVMLRLSQRANAGFLVAVCVGSFLLFPESTNRLQNTLYKATLAQQYPYPARQEAVVTLQRNPPPVDRLEGRTNRAANISGFLGEYLQDDETFYDFANAPLLYALSGKRYPGFVIETFFHTSEKMQTTVVDALAFLRARGKLPLVVFKQLPDSNPWNHMDGIATAVRSYRVAEFIYEHYAPCAKLNGYEVWLARDRLASQPCTAALVEDYAGTAPVQAHAQRFELQKLPWLWANHDEIWSAPNCGTAGTLKVSQLPGKGAYRIQLPPGASGSGPSYLQLLISAERDTRATLNYRGGNGFSFDVVASRKPEEYLIRTSMQYAWYTRPVEAIQLRSDHPLTLACAAVLPAD